MSSQTTTKKQLPECSGDTQRGEKRSAESLVGDQEDEHNEMAVSSKRICLASPNLTPEPVRPDILQQYPVVVTMGRDSVLQLFDLLRSKEFRNGTSLSTPNQSQSTKEKAIWYVKAIKEHRGNDMIEGFRMRYNLVKLREQVELLCRDKNRYSGHIIKRIATGAQEASPLVSRYLRRGKSLSGVCAGHPGLLAAIPLTSRCGFLLAKHLFELKNEDIDLIRTPLEGSPWARALCALGSEVMDIVLHNAPQSRQLNDLLEETWRFNLFQAEKEFQKLVLKNNKKLCTCELGDEDSKAE